MKTLQWAAAVLAVGALALPARAETTTTNDWWNVTFEPGSFKEGFPGLTVGELGTLTNDEAKAQVTQPYASGVWSMIDGDESYVTNQYNPTNVPAGSFGQDYCIKLDTQGNDLTWTPTGTVDKLSYLVDADLYLVGSDSAPDAADFDAASDVQTAIYLKNETDEDTGETTNSVLCVYVEDVSGHSYWQELKGVELEDNAWAHVQVLVNRSGTDPLVSVFVNGTQMSARDGDALSWLTANKTTSGTNGKVNSVAFRGTGAVDNFAGKTLETTFSSYDFTAEVYMNDVLQEVGSFGNVTRVVHADAGTGLTVPFESFLLTDADYDQEIDPTWSLTKIEITNFVDGTTTTIDYEWNSAYFRTDASAENDGVDIKTEGGYQTGLFDLELSTAGATANSTIVRIYFEDLPEEGTFNAKATTTVGETTTTDSRKVKPSEFAESGATKTITWTFPAEKDGNLLSTIQVYEGATLNYADKTATVTVTLDAALQADTLFAAATYGVGSLAEGQDLRWTEENGLYTFEAYVPPVAIIVAEVEGVLTTNEYPSLRAAIAAAEAGETVYLVADDRVSFSAEDTEIVIGKALTIDGGSNTLYGVTDYAYDGVNDHDIFIGAAAGDVTFKNLKISEFSDTAPTVQYRTYPIWTSQAYAGKLTLDGVTIDKFARTAVNLGNGTFEITNCVIAGYAGSETAPANYFQNAITLLDAKGTVAETTVTGIGTHEGSKWGAGLVTFNKDGDGEVTFLSGSYTADFVIEVSSNATGKVVISNGTFVATAPAEDEGEAVSAFQFDEEAADRTLTVTIAGGWFDREPEAEFIAAGLAAYEDAPGTDAPWTVRAAKVTIDFYVDDEVYVSTNVVVGTLAAGYAPANPTKEDTAQYAYAFTGWTNSVGESFSAATLPAVTTATNYYATFSVVVRQYDVEWIVDGTYTTNTWNYGATPSYDENDATVVPTKAPTDATNYTFAAWSPAVEAVTGPGASYTATWTESARTYAITFQTNGVVYITVDAEWHETGYGPADPAAPEGYVFVGWTNSVAGGAVVTAANLPQVTGAATWTAVFEENAVDPIAVTIGGDTDNPLPAGKEAITVDDTDGFTLRFAAKQTGVTYILQSAATVDGQFSDVTVNGTAVSVTPQAVDEVVELSDPDTTSTVKFFRVKVVVAE